MDTTIDFPRYGSQILPYPKSFKANSSFEAVATPTIFLGAKLFEKLLLVCYAIALSVGFF